MQNLLNPVRLEASTDDSVTRSNSFTAVNSTENINLLSEIAKPSAYVRQNNNDVWAEANYQFKKIYIRTPTSQISRFKTSTRMKSLKAHFASFFFTTSLIIQSKKSSIKRIRQRERERERQGHDHWRQSTKS